MKNLRIKLSIAIICTTLLCNQLYSQLLDKPLEKYRTQIFNFLKTAQEIPSDEVEVDYNGKIYSRLLGPSKKKLFFQIGITSPHSRRYILAVRAEEIKLFNTSSLLDDLPQILSVLKTFTKELNSADTILFIQEINAIYAYNASPPWLKK